jgi:hypothetical protein
MEAISTNLLIRSTQLTQGEVGNEYEFILDNQLNVLKWVKLKRDRPQVFHPIDAGKMTLEGMLFELNHVRVNPLLDNTRMIAKLTDALTDIGVTVCNQPHKTSMAICFKPMGEIRDNVRFYLNKERKLVFLSPITRPRLVYSKPKA